jgi:hypothetical protein
MPSLPGAVECKSTGDNAAEKAGCAQRHEDQEGDQAANAKSNSKSGDASCKLADAKTGPRQKQNDPHLAPSRRAALRIAAEQKKNQRHQVRSQPLLRDALRGHCLHGLSCEFNAAIDGRRLIYDHQDELTSRRRRLFLLRFVRVGRIFDACSWQLSDSPIHIANVRR